MTVTLGFLGLRTTGRDSAYSFVWSKNMNMISNGAFLNEMDSSNKQKDLVSKLVTAWEKKNSKVARAGGVSLMALSLAACGDADDTPFSQADVDAAAAAATTAALTGADGTVYASVDAAKTAGVLCRYNK